MPSARPTPDEVPDLRRCVRDLVAVSTLPAVWENADALGIGRGLAEVLLRLLAADFLYVRLHGRDGGPPLEALWTRQRAETESRAHEVGKSLEPWLRSEDAHAPTTIPNPLGDGMLCLAVFPLGHGHDHGLLAAGCGRANFPSDTERLLLGVAVNQAAGLFQRKEAEEQLRRSEQELADFFEDAAVRLHWVGPDGTILRVNQAELDLLGYSREEYLGRPIAAFHADRDVIEDILRRLSAGEPLRDYEARMRCKNGTLKHVRINSNGCGRATGSSTPAASPVTSPTADSPRNRCPSSPSGYGPHIVPPHGAGSGGEAATIEFAVAALGVKDIVICGHSHCGAMRGLLQPEQVVSLPAVSLWLSHAETTRRIVTENDAHLEGIGYGRPRSRRTCWSNWTTGGRSRLSLLG